MVDFINLTINKKDIIYDGKVKMTKGNKGVIRIKNKLFNNFTYVIFPILRQNDGGNVIISVDEILNKETRLEEDKTHIDFSRRYVGRKCIVISSQFPLNLELRKQDIILDGKVKNTWSGQGIIRLNDKFLGNRSYVIFPIYSKDTSNGVIMAIDEILNKGIHPENDHSSGIGIGQKYVGRKCITILQEG